MSVRFPETLTMTPLTPADIIEGIVDELARGELGERIDAFR
jgi:hypothetical protein